MQNIANIANVSGFSGSTAFDISTFIYNKITSIPDLLIYYPFDETSGDAINKAPDTIGSYDGTVTDVTQGVVGNLGKAYYFNGSSAYVIVQDAIATLDDFTISFFLSTTTTATVTRMCGVIEDGTNDLIQIAFNSSKTFTASAGNTAVLVRFNAGAQAGFQFTNSAVYDGSLHHHALVRNGGATLYYIDGVAQTLNYDVATLGTQQLTMARTLAIGAINNRGVIANFGEATQQHFAIFNRDLTATEILGISQSAGLA